MKHKPQDPQYLRSCHGCKHFDGGIYDHDTGYQADASCEVAGALFDNGECSEAVSMIFQELLFQFSALNNCPLREEPRPRGLRDLSRRHGS